MRARGVLVILLLALGSLTRSALADAPATLAKLNVAALAVGGAGLYVAGFDEGLFLVEPGGRVHAFHDPALSSYINALAWSEPEHALWIGTARGVVRCRMDPRQGCRRVGPSAPVHALHLRPSGELVSGGDAGLMFVSGNDVRMFGKKQGAPFRAVWALAETDGVLFVGSTQGLFWGKLHHFARAGELRRASLVQGSLPDDWVTALLYEREQLHVGTYNAGVVSFLYGAEQLSPGVWDGAAGYVNPAGIAALSNGELAVASMNGLRRGAPGKTRPVPTRARDVTAIVPAANRAGYWVGTRQGLEWLDTVTAVD